MSCNFKKFKNTKNPIAHSKNRCSIIKTVKNKTANSDEPHQFSTNNFTPKRQQTNQNEIGIVSLSIFNNNSFLPYRGDTLPLGIVYYTECHIILNSFDP
jgi:hypothetical protein